MSRLTKHLVWTAAEEPGPNNVRTRLALAATSRLAGAAMPAEATATECPETLTLDISLPARERAVYLLHIGANRG